MSRNSAEKIHSEESSKAPLTESEREDQGEARQDLPRVQPIEPEDAQLTGSSRSLHRRVLGLNVQGRQAQQHPDTAAGQHATGSYTDEKSKESGK